MEYQIRRKLGANGPLQREIDKCAALNADAGPSSPGLSYLQVILVQVLLVRIDGMASLEIECLLLLLDKVFALAFG